MVASQDARKLAVVWVRRTGPSTGVIQVARSSDGGASWAAAETVTPTAQNVENPRIVASSDLSVLRVFWVQRDVSTGTIRTSGSVDGGAWPSAYDVTSGLTLGDSAAYSVSAAPNGQTVHVVWTEKVPLTSYEVIKWRFTFNGLTWSSESALSTTPGIASRPVVANWNGGNGVTVMWNHVNAPQARTTQMIRRSSGSWGSVRTLSPAGSGSAFDVDLALPSGTSGAAIWSQFDQKTDRVPYVAINSGGTWSDAAVISSGDTFDQRIAVAFDGARMVALWGTKSGLKARVRVSGAWQPIVALPGPAGDQIQLAASSNAQQLVAVWRTSTAAMAAATSADGGSTWTGLPSPAGPTVAVPRTVIDADGKRFATSWAVQQGSSWFTRASAGPSLVPEVSVTPSVLDFGNVTKGDTAIRSVTIRNTGLAPLRISGLSVSGADFGQSVSWCLLPLQPSATCFVDVTLNPGSAGPKSGSLTITDDATGSPRTVALSGTGVDPVSPTPSPTARRAQLPRDRKGVPPQRIRREGKTVIVGRNALTTANQRIVTRVRIKAQKDRFRLLKKRQGKIIIRTFGKPLKRVTLVQTAPETSQYLPYIRKTVYRKGKR